MCGASVDGTFCEYAVAYTDYVTPIPDGLDSAEATAIMCAVRALELSVGVTKTNRGLARRVSLSTARFCRVVRMSVIGLSSPVRAEDSDTSVRSFRTNVT